MRTIKILSRRDFRVMEIIQDGRTVFCTVQRRFTFRLLWLFPIIYWLTRYEDVSSDAGTVTRPMNFSTAEEAETFITQEVRNCNDLARLRNPTRREYSSC